ncbi:MAG: ABC transporter ATP-binding protein [Persicimonas sp.]
MPETLLDVEDLAWRLPDSGELLFEEVTFEVEAGERVVLRGPSGSGKSTLLRCIVGLEPRAAGRVYWRGEPVEADNIRRFRSRAVYVQQRPTAVAETLEENFSFARRMAAELDADAEPMDADEQRELCDEIGLGRVDFSRRFDDLSVGEQQRACLVRALTGRPNLLLLDEPSSALDPERVTQVEELLCDYVEAAPETRAFLWINHQPDQIERLASRVIDLGRWAGGADA